MPATTTTKILIAQEDGTVVAQITSELSNRSILSYWKQRMLGEREA